MPYAHFDPEAGRAGIDESWKALGGVGAMAAAPCAHPDLGVADESAAYVGRRSA